MDLVFDDAPSTYVLNSNFPDTLRIIGQWMLPINEILSFHVVHFQTYNKKCDFSEVSTGYLVDCSNVMEENIVLVTTKHSILDPENQICQVRFHFVNIEDKTCRVVTVKFPCTGYTVDGKLYTWVQSDFDFAALQVTPLLAAIKEWYSKTKNSSLYKPLIYALNIYSEVLHASYGAPAPAGYFSDVVMLGYPLELSNANFLPIARFGHCASNPKFSNRSDPKPAVQGDFLVDMSCACGSSGSPIWYFWRSYDATLKSTEGEDDEVSVADTIKYSFAGMLFASPSDISGKDDVHLGCVDSANTVGTFLRDNFCVYSDGDRAAPFNCPADIYYAVLNDFVPGAANMEASMNDD